jgi:hypothetical protein
MSTDSWRRALEVIRSRFEKAADIYPLLRHRLYEYRADSIDGVEPFPVGSARHIEHIFCRESLGFQWRVYTRTEILDPSAPDEKPTPWEGWAMTMIPYPHNWVGRASFNGAGCEVLDAIAEDAWNLIKVRPELLPIPAEMLTDVREFYPAPAPLIPIWTYPGNCWGQVVHWIGRQRTHPVFRIEPMTWWRGIPSTRDKTSLDAIRAMFRREGHALPDLDGLPPRIFSDITSLFSASVWALDWLEERAALADEAVKPMKPIQPHEESSSEGGKVAIPLTKPSSADSLWVEPTCRPEEVEATLQALAAFERLTHQFALILASNAARPPDLHLVVVRAPAPGLPQLTDAAMDALPIGLIRPDLARKERHSRFPEKIPSLPATRILFLGDSSWLDRYVELSMEAATTLRAHNRAIDQWVKRATVDERFYMGNLWSLASMEIGERVGPKGFVQRYRLRSDPLVPFVPYAEDEYIEWMNDEEARRGRREETSKAVSIAFFQMNVFELSLEVAKFYVRDIILRAEPNETFLRRTIVLGI